MAAAAAGEALACEGWLRKRSTGVLAKWQRRYFALARHPGAGQEGTFGWGLWYFDEDAGRAEGFDAAVDGAGEGSVASSLWATAHPLDTRFTNIFGA
jgi:hypothetical protein